MARVSVITPAHDNALTIVATVESVLDQRYGDWELIVCDDASSDETPQLVSAFGARDARVRLVRAQSNVGPAGARNLALERASGELVAFLDADDRWHPDYLAEQLTLFDREQARTGDVGIVACDADRADAAGRPLPDSYVELNGAADGASLTRLLLGNAVFISALCPRAVVAQAGGFSTECWGSEDHDLWLRIVELGYRVVGNPRRLVTYRVAEGSVSASRLRMARTDQATFRRALERGRLDAEQRAIATERLALAVAAERAANGLRLRDARALAAAARARLALSRRRAAMMRP